MSVEKQGFTAVHLDEYGSGKRERKDVNYNDGLTEAEFVEMVSRASRTAEDCTFRMWNPCPVIAQIERGESVPGMTHGEGALHCGHCLHHVVHPGSDSPLLVPSCAMSCRRGCGACAHRPFQEANPGRLIRHDCRRRHIRLWLTRVRYECAWGCCGISLHSTA